MQTKQVWLAMAAILFLAGRSWSATGMANMKGTTKDSNVSGTLKLEDTKDGLKMTGTIDNAPPGDHAFHIHDFGDCSDEGKNAGSHYNPDNHPHGHTIQQGVSKVHAGDMGNLTFDKQGTTTVNLVIPGVKLMDGKYNVAGRAVVLHEKHDDFGQPTGNAGGRIACGPIVLTGK